MKNLGIRAFAAVLLGAAALLATGSAGRAAGPSDPAFVDVTREGVTEAQVILQHLGHLAAGGHQRGVMDAATREAVAAFQVSHSLRRSGALDWETVSQLLPHRPAGDGDGDGVPDPLDKCPGTPKGARVDTRGCPVDSDGDGVAEGLDKCPGTAKGLRVDREGCPIDSDRDGVFDGPDRCADTPKGAKVDADGCPVDGDGDGVPDGLDQCPATPQGIKVRADGCAIDSDGDGVTDDRDKCPDTPKGAKVDANGCPEAAPVPALAPVVFEPGKRSLVLEGVNFATNSARLDPSSSAVLDRVAEALVANPEVRVEVGGHTDSTGSATRNATLSKERARAVADYLVGKGVPPARLEWKGYAATQPVADNASAAGRAKNRRVELKRID